MEAHLISAESPIFECSAFESAGNKRLGVEVRIQQDVSSEETNPCHSKHEPSDECVFTKINNGQIQFRDGDGRLTSSIISKLNQTGETQSRTSLQTQIFSKNQARRWFCCHDCAA